VGNLAMNDKDKNELIYALAKEAAIIKAKLDSMRDMYGKLDELTLALKDLTGEEEIFLNVRDTLVLDGKLITISPQYIKVVDNFATKNTVFKNTGVKRFEILNETVTERAARNLK
jgi:hypothetical protein